MKDSGPAGVRDDFVREMWPRMFATLNRSQGVEARPGVREK